MQSEYKTYSGEIVKGRQLGRTVGLPTINIFPTEDASDLKRGVYFSKVIFNSGKHQGGTYFGVTNVGCKPTVQTTDKINFETYILNFSDDVYGEEAAIVPLFFSRPEIKFNSFEELTGQIQSDVKAAMAFFDRIQ